MPTFTLKKSARVGGPLNLPSRLNISPSVPASEATPGLHPLALASGRDGILFVPLHHGPLPLVILLHGSGGDARDIIGLLRPAAEKYGFALLVPESRAYTWDVIVGGFGPDVKFIERAIAKTMSMYRLDADRISIAGFSDGASYALSLGLSNSDVFSRIVAFSPGFKQVATPNGRPEIFVSHGTDDRVLPIARCGRKVTRELEDEGYPVRYVEFEGGHAVPPGIVDEAMNWLARDGSVDAPKSTTSQEAAQ